jgi:hypothetical protein
MQLDKRDRDEAYSRMDPVTQTEFWVRRVQEYSDRRRSRGKLSPRHLDILDRAIEHATSHNVTEDAQLRDEAIETFGFAVVKRLFTTLDDIDIDDDLLLPLPAEDEKKIGARGFECTCAEGDDWCGYGLDCLKGTDGMTCNYQKKSCGWWNRKECNGICWDAP